MNIPWAILTITCTIIGLIAGGIVGASWYNDRITRLRVELGNLERDAKQERLVRAREELGK